MESNIDTTRDAIIERFPMELVTRSWWYYVCSIGIPCGVFCFLPFLVAATDTNLDGDGPIIWLAAAGLTAMLLSFCALLVFSTASVLHRRLRSNLPSVELRNDMVTLRIGQHTSLSADVSECRIRRGRAYRMRIGAVPWGITMFCWFPVILIDLPPFERTFVGVYYSRNTVAVGLTTESLLQWERALLQHVGENK